jgi:hypothetical protein
VACFALRVPDRLLLIDPQLPADDAALLQQLDRIVHGPVSILTTMPYHVRSSERLAERYDARIHGHPNVARRLERPERLIEVRPGDELPGGVTAHAIGKPRRNEMPLYVHAHGALAFGDAVVGTGDSFRMWDSREPGGARTAWYRDRFAPTLRPLLRLDVRHLLVTHGPPAVGNGSDALRAALAQPPWYHRG